MSAFETEGSRLDGVAVVGMSLRFPGASSVQAFWNNLCNGIESIERFSPEQLAASGVAPELITDPNFVAARGLFEAPEAFDAAFFGISVREAELMDPQHRVFLETCWAALEDAGYAPSKIAGAVGVWGGMSTGMANNTYLLSNLHGANAPRLEPEDALPAMLGNENDYLTTRVSFKLNLTGPSVNVQTACSTSLVAITQAYQSLMLYGCDMALAGGVSVSYPQQDGYLFQEGGIGSPDGHCRPFDADAQGTVFSNGVGVVTLKRLEDAVADGDTVYAVIRGAALNNDGSDKMSFAAPSVAGQAEVIATAHAVADVDADSIGYVECHGTATPIGDPIEVAALTQAFRGTSERKNFCALGSVKSNFGHLDSAAGVAAFIKAVLAVYHGKIPPTLHYRSPNPQIDFDSSPFYVASGLADWPADAGPRRAGVSGFGIGGTNAHVVLEQPPTSAPPPVTADPTQQTAELLLVSAKSRSALEHNLINLAEALAENEQTSLAAVAHTLREGREAFRYRRSVCGSDRLQAANALQALAGSSNRIAPAAAAPPALAMMFPGGGAQYVAMAAGLYERFPTVAEAIDKGIAAFEAISDLPLRATWFAAADDADAQAAFERPALQLPAIFILEVALVRLWESFGVRPQALIGHSMGENTAACVASVMSFEDALGLVALRGNLFEQVPAGGMLSLAADETAAGAYLGDGIDLATVNAPDQCTLSGSSEALDALETRLAADDVEYQRVPIHIAAHSHLLEPILEAFHDYLCGIDLHKPQIPIVSNLTGVWLSDEQATSPQYWVDHLRNTVRFSAGLNTLVTASNHVLLECGPGKILSSLARLQHSTVQMTSCNSLRHSAEQRADAEVFLDCVGALWCQGLDIDFSPLHSEAARRVRLPTYAFDRTTYLIEPDRTTGHASVVDSQQAATAPSATVGATPQAVEVAAKVTAFSTPLETPNMPSRYSLISAKLVSILHDLSGIPEAEISTAETFLDMGFDSLFLTQANLRFKKTFKVKITFRQLFDDAPTIDALAQFIDTQLPDDALSAELASAQPVTSASASVAPADAGAPQASDAPLSAVPGAMAPNLSGANADVLQQAIMLQIQASNSLLLALGQAATTAAPAAAAAATAPVDVQTQPAASADVATPVAEDSEQAQAARALGPYKPIDHGPTAFKLSDAARMALEEFARAYSARTAKSKALSAEQRSYLSDARSISGFRQEWKEIVYQIAAGKGSKGSRIYDLDGNEYVDVTSGFGINLFGYSPQWAVDAAHAQLDEGIELGTLSPKAAEAARLIRDLTGMDRSTFTNTGSEAISASIRAARTTTGKDMIAVFYDEYHGISDEVLVNLVKTNGVPQTVPTSPGIPQNLVDQVMVLEWNDPNCMERIRDAGDDLAAVIVEPVQNRNPSLKTAQRFEELRSVTRENDIALIYDEMITGFRLAPGGAQEYFGVEADMVCYGKIVGGGMPIAVVAGRGEYLDCFDGGPWQFGDDSFPEAGVTFFGGTYTRHPIALATAVAALEHIKEFGKSGYQALNARARAFAHRLNTLLVSKGFPARIENCETIFNLKFNDDNPYSRLIFWQLRHRGVLVYDRPFFISDAHSTADFDFVFEQFANSIDFLQDSGIVAACDIAGEYGIEKVVPFNQAQLEVYLATQLGDAASRAFNEQVIYHFDGCLDVPALEHAIAKVVYKHDALRARVSRDTEGFVVTPAWSVPLAVEVAAAGDDQEQALDAVYRRHLQAPFALTEAPLLRFALIERAQQDGTSQHTLLITAHHLIIDGWSMGIVLKELAEIYDQVINSERCLPRSEHQIADYLEDEIEYRDSEEYAETAAYWRGRFDGVIPKPVQLPLDHPRPSEQGFRGQRHAYRFGKNITSALRSASNAQNCTSFTFLFTLFAYWLSRTTGQNDLVIAVPMAGQAVAGMPNLVGHSVSFLPLRVRCEDNEPFAAALRRNRDLVMEANDHQRFTYLELLQSLQVKRDPSQPPLVPISFNVDQGMDAFHFGGMTARYEVCPRDYVKNDMFFNLVEEADEYTLELDRNTEVLDAATVDVWVAQFRELLNAALADPTQVLDRVPLPGQSEQAAELAQWNSTAEDYGLEGQTLVSRFEAAVDRWPDLRALRFEDATLSYSQLDKRANQVAQSLLAAGVALEDRVALLMERSFEMVVAIYGVLKAGAAYVPIDPEQPLARIAGTLADCDARLVLTQTRFTSLVPGGLDSLALDDASASHCQASRERPGLSLSPRQLAYVIYTSGSTGQPKGVMIEHAAVLNRLLWGQQALGLEPGDRHVQKTPYTFDVSVPELFWPLQVGATLVLSRPGGHQDAPYLYRLLRDEAVNVAHFVPSMLHAFLREADAEPLPALRQVYCSGEALTGPLRDAFFARFPEVQLFNLYGPTEAAVEVSAYQCRKDDADVSVPIGRPIANTQLHVLDASMQPVAHGVAGELYIGGVQVARGYHERPELTAERFIEDPFHTDGRLYRTGDLVRRRSDGELEFLGRTDGQVKLRGYRIELGEIEAALLKLDGVSAAAAAIHQLDGADQRLLAFVQMHSGHASQLSVVEMRRALALELPVYMIPQAFVPIAQLPLNSSGKLDRQALLAYAGTQFQPVQLRKPDTASEQIVARIWAHAIKLEAGSISSDDNFFDIGGHSLLAMEVLRKLDRVFGRRLSLRDMLYHPLSDIAAMLPEAPLDDLERQLHEAELEQQEQARSGKGGVVRRVLNMLSQNNP